MSVTSSAPIFTDKGSRYFTQLDQALCNGSWSEVDELSRKVDKHAPERKCFTLAARCEAQIAQALQRSRLSPSFNGDSTKGFNDLASQLLHSVFEKEHFADDAYVAQVCVAEIRWLKEEYHDAIEALSHDKRPAPTPAGYVAALGWLDVCEVKADIIHLASYLELKRQDDARKLCLKVGTRVPGSRTPELRRWTEQLLARVCKFMDPGSEETTLHSLSQSLRCFRAWSDFWRRSSSSLSSGSITINADIDVPRRQVWRAYYSLVTTVLQHGLMYNITPTNSMDLLLFPSDVADEHSISAQIRQRSELRNVEVNYESLLLNQTQFPKANQTNTEVEAWVQKVVSNWRIFNSSSWPEDSLGEGGKESLGRAVLDILYRSTTKTYHSTATLRYLSTVHTSLGEFDLAMHAFKSYSEIFSRDKLRTAKAETRDSNFDSVDVAIITAAETIRVLCRYGDREQGAKAVEIGKSIMQWLHEDDPSPKVSVDPTRPEKTSGSARLETARCQTSTLAAAHRAIGISKANWARLTYETRSRSQLREEAIEAVRTAQVHDENSIETAYTLALLLAEDRDVSAAVKISKQVIAKSRATDGAERLLLPMWHLLAMCLTARRCHEQAIQMCDAAFTQFGDPEVLFGDLEQRSRSDKDEKSSIEPSRKGLVDQMEGYEKETLIQLKMSRIALLELTEGIESAVDSSYELLALYARLFGTPKFGRPVTESQPPATAASAAPTKIGGTLKSIAGSIRSRSVRQSMEKSPKTASTISVSGRKVDTANSTPVKGHDDRTSGVPIAITITNEDGVATGKSSHHKHLPFHRQAEHGSLKAKSSPLKTQQTLEDPSNPTLRPTTPNGSLIDKDKDLTINDNNTVGNAHSSPDQKLDCVPHNIAHREMPPPPGHQEQPPQQDVRLPAPHPSTCLVPDARFPAAQDRQQRISLLIKLWLFIAGLYLRAELFEDAGNAIDEARTLVESFETEAAAEQADAQRFYDKGWGGGKSIDALWADVWSARGYLAVARNLPFEALSEFEQALAYFPDHPDGIIGISKILMDIFEEKIPPEEPRVPLAQRPSASSQTLSIPVPPTPQRPAEPPEQEMPTPPGDPGKKANASRDLLPPELNRLASRDRAYMLLDNLTRLGSGWDNAEAWSTLARAHELSKQISKAKEALWWVVELEEHEPIRPWNQIAPGGYTL